MNNSKLVELFNKHLANYSSTIQREDEDGNWDFLYTESQATLALLDALKELTEEASSK